jgi:pilus assembly protein CpaC
VPAGPLAGGPTIVVPPPAGGIPPAWQPGQAVNAPAATAATNGPPIVLTKGSLRALNFNEPVTRIIVTDGAIVDASVLSERQVRLAAMKNGRTYVTITTASGGPATYAVTVVPDLAGVQAMLARDPGLRGLRVASEDDHLVVSGYLGSVQAHAHALDVLHAYYGDQVIDMIQTGGDQMIAVSIKFAAVQADTLKELGFNLTALGHGFSFIGTGPNSIGSYNGNGNALTDLPLPLASAFNVLLASSNSNVAAIISALSQSNLAATLAEPTLLVRSGDQASFVAGGEVPIPVPQSSGGAGSVVTIEYHQYGVQLRIAPTVMADGRIAMTVAPEVSSIDTSNALSLQGYSVPAFLKRSTSTTVELADGQSFVLAGLLYSSVNITENKFPGLGDLPIIGNFFRYSTNSREKQELIIVATPHIVQPISAATPLPPLPGVEFQRGYDPSVKDMFLNRKPADAAIEQYGLMR